jgi:broad specificity phosphatase PhoE
LIKKLHGIFGVMGLMEKEGSKFASLFPVTCGSLLAQRLTPFRSAEEVTIRLDSLISEIHFLHAPNMHGEAPCDVVLVAHGHILRAFVKRWLKYPMEFPLSLMLEPGAVGILSYQDNDIEKPAMFFGMAFPLSQ